MLRTRDRRVQSFSYTRKSDTQSHSAPFHHMNQSLLRGDLLSFKAAWSRGPVGVVRGIGKGKGKSD